MTSASASRLLPSRVLAATLIALLAVAQTFVQGCGSPSDQTPPSESAALPATQEGDAPSPDAEPTEAEPVEDIRPLSVVGTVPLPGDALKGRITVFFDQDIKVEGQDKPEATPPFTMDPPFVGTYTIGRNYIDIASDKFSPTAPLTLTLNDDIKSTTGNTLGTEARTLNFAPFTFEVRRIWQLEQSAEREVIGVLFPTSVAPEALQQNMTVTDADGAPVAVTVEPGSQPDILRLVIPTGIKLPVHITVGTGLTDSTGAFQLANEFIAEYPSFADLLVTSAKLLEPDGEAPRVRFRFSKAIDAETLKEHLSIKDEAGAPISFEIVSDGQTTEPDVRVSITDETRSDITLEISPGLEGLEHATLRETFTKTLPARALQVDRELSIADDYWDYADRDGLALSLGFNIPINVVSMKEHLKIEPKVENVRVELGYNARRAKIFGDWDSGKSYRLNFSKGMTIGAGAKTADDVEYSVTADTVPRYIGFGQKGKYYFPRRDGIGLPLETRNASKVKLRLFRMFPSNIAVAVGDMENGEPWTQFLRAWSEYITDQDLDVKLQADRLVSTPLTLDTTIPEGKRGVFCLAAYDKTSEGEDEEYYDEEGGAADEDSASPESEYPSATKLILFTNIGLLAHWLDNELLVFAHDLYTLEPKAAAKVTIWSAKNQVLATGSTDERGVAKLGPFETRLGLPSVVVVEAGDDATFLHLEPRNDDTREISPDMPKFDRKAYDAFLYADRELYRPGEPVYLRWLVRSNYGDALANVPLTYSIDNPNGEELTSGPTTLSAAGTGGLDLTTEKEYPTGEYTVNLNVPGSKKPIGTYSFKLEEFVPNTMKAALTVAEAVWLSGEKYAIKLNAQHLFGAAAADRRADAKIVLRPAAYRPEQWKTYTFGNDTPYKSETVTTDEVQTDGAGNAEFPFSYAAPPDVTYPLSALIIGRVYELGGRAVADTKEITVLPAPISLGVGLAPADSGQGVLVNVAAINPDETPAALSSVKVTLEKQVWNYYVRRYYDYHEPNWSESFEPMETRDVALNNGAGATTFDVKGYGYFRVRVHSDKTPQFSTLSFYSYGGQPHLVNAARPSLIKLTLDKPKYVVGEQATVRIEAPFDGKSFVVLQGQELQQAQVVDIVNGVGNASFPVSTDQYPNIWIEATVVHAIKEGQDQVYPFSSLALAPVKIEDPARSIAVSFPGLPEEIRPLSDAQFVVETRDATGAPQSVELTLAAVDEGIHAITGYESPDPLSYLSRVRRPDYRRTHYYDKVAYDFDKTRIGGDLEALLAKRAAAIDENWIKPVSLWSGVVQTDANGQATVNMKVPEYSGQLRLVAIAASPRATGAQTGFVYVRRPYTLRTSMPRFLLPGDKATCRATLHNNTDSPAKAIVSWTVEGTIEVNSGSQEVDVPAKGEAHALVDFVAAQAVGQAAIQWFVTFRDASGADAEKLEQRAPIPVRAPAVFQSDHQLIVLNPGESTTVKNSKFLEDKRTEVSIVAGANPVLRVFDALKHVVSYPYGCVEQTTSRLFPMYLLKQNSELAAMQLDKGENLDGFIQSGINRLFSMQTDSGGLGFWPGAESPYDYGSVYALHFLTLVKNDRQIALQEKNMEDLQNYVRKISRDWSDSSESSLYKRAYAVYVLALGGDNEALKQIQRFDSVKLPRSARFMLAAALAINGENPDRVSLYMSNTPSVPYVVTEPDGTLNSEIRNDAVELLALQQMKGDAKQMSELAGKLTAYITANRYGTTQETAFICASLITYLSEIAQNVDTAKATIEGPKGKSEIKGKESFSGEHNGPGGQFVITNSGRTAIYVSATTRGVPEQPDTTPISQGIALTRTVYNEKGEPHAGTSFGQADSFVIGIELNCDRPAKNVVIADLIPAGFEIQNPRLDADAIPSDAFKNRITPTYLEVRDDRLVAAFDSIDTGKHNLYYIVRAVTPGHYQYPAVTGEGMYDASVRGRGVPGEIDVVAQ
ncbi:MAG: hypothetical protein HUU46_04865 [Candidatus Hydrogenedentes bacterium]|nr:hypothetical protein [Candidatus Hydrogenedentota bacterium]